MPEGSGLSVLRRFVYSGCKAIGIKELQAIHLESGKRCFPYDYPETEAGRDWKRNFVAEKQVQKYLLKPPSKRVNFQKLKIPNPFGNYREHSRTFNIRLESVGRGVPKDNAHLYLPSLDDIR